MLHLNQQVKSKILEERKGWLVTPSKPLYSYFGHVLRYRNTDLADRDIAMDKPDMTMEIKFAGLLGLRFLR
ncbi:hypothetical protein NC651_000445 [Populus alba x Populus x berolinensis]|nr:hypothetical protein NC651_000389 [Populus alba x Populus x berolinensis]KAJ6945398.1 hypothetical protein NC651_000445 [Populus alba x Populus x berolinensis]